jgi:hypothetical protein
MEVVLLTVTLASLATVCGQKRGLPRSRPTSASTIANALQRSVRSRRLRRFQPRRSPRQ